MESPSTLSNSTTLQATLSGTGQQDWKHYTKPDRAALNLAAWPATASTYSPALHDLKHYQGILNNANNFAAPGTSSLKILEIGDSDEDGELSFDDDEHCINYFDRAIRAIGSVTAPKWQSRAAGTKDNSKKLSLPAYRVIFCTLKKVDEGQKTSFRHKLSLSRTVVEKILSMFMISPSFLSKLVGEPDYWSPEVSQSSTGSLKCVHLSCQHPRWDIHNKQTALSVYMAYDVDSKCTTYIMVGDEDCEVTARVRDRLRDFAEVMSVRTPNDRIHDPLMIHCLISQASLEAGKDVFNRMRGRLYKVLDQVDKFAAKEFDSRPDRRQILERATVELSDVSQNFDSTLASLEMAERIAEHLELADQALQKQLWSSRPLALDFRSDQMIESPSTDAVSYIKQSVSAQIHWLRSWKARKDTSLSLVFNLVTQQDAASAAQTATAAQADGSSMKAIAALTMLFLPATFLAALFGIADLHIAEWHSYWEIVIPMTVVIFIAWFIWEWFASTKRNNPRGAVNPSRGFKWPFRRSKSNKADDVELGTIKHPV